MKLFTEANNNEFQHNGGIKSLKIWTEGPDGYRQEIWQMTDFTMESNEQWWKGQVNFNDHMVRRLFGNDRKNSCLYNYMCSFYRIPSKKVFHFQLIFEVTHGDQFVQSGYVALDKIQFHYDSDYNCEVLPPDAGTQPTDPPSSEPSDADFENGWDGWSEDSGLNSEESFAWSITTGAEQDGVSGPQEDYDSTSTSKT